VSLLVTELHNLANDGAILDGLDHVIGDIRARDLETEKRQVTFLHTILSGEGSSVSCGGRTMVQSSSLWLKIRSIADVSATTPGKKQSPEKVHRRKIEALNKKATDSTTTRLTCARCMALVNATANRCKRLASASAIGTRGPNADENRVDLGWPAPSRQYSAGRLFDRDAVLKFP